MFVSRSTVLSLIISIVAIALFNYKTSGHSDFFKNFTTITKENGYITEEHTVTTEDGYLLNIFRIKRGKNCGNSSASIPVLLMHGLFESSDLFIDAGPNAGLAYLLSDACYDLWVGNTRGNYYARKHTTLNPDKDKEFWKFSADEIGLYDLPAKIDYIQKITEKAKVNFIGYSQGGSTPFIMCSELPEYCDKLGIIISLAPATRLVNMRSLAITKLFEIILSIEDELNMFGIHELFPRNGIVQVAVEYVCGAKVNALTRYICLSIVDILDVYNPESITDDTLRSMFRHFPGGSSIRNAARYGQILKTGKIQKYDYGEVGNMEKYGTVLPPVYDFKSVRTPVVIFQGKNDYLTDITDSKWTVEQLPNSELFVVEDPLWNHLDMVYSQHINNTIFGHINKFLLKYSN